MAQPFPIHSWKLIRPCVVSAVKLGASLLILKDMTHLRIVKTVRSSTVSAVCLRGRARGLWCSPTASGARTLAPAGGDRPRPGGMARVPRPGRGPQAPVDAPKSRVALIYSQGYGESSPSD